MRLLFAWLTFTLSFCKPTVKHAIKQMIWLSAFFKHFRTYCEILWLNVIHVWIAAVFHSFLFLLTLISFLGIDFHILLSFFQVVGLSTFGDEKFLQNTQKMWFYMANHGNIFRVYYKFSKKHSREIQPLFYPVLFYFGEKMWLILYFSKLSS